VYAVLDKLARQPREVSAEKLAAAGVASDVAEIVLGLGALDFTKLRAAYGDAPSVAPHIARVSEYLTHSESLGTASWIDVDLTIVRGLAYYTGIVFELFDARGEFRAICGGGRYDNLLGALGGTDMPALGFGMGDVVLGEFLRERGLMPAYATGLDYWVMSADPDAAATSRVLTVTHALREQGRSVEYAFRPMSFKKQLEAAEKAGASQVAVIKSGAVPSDELLVRVMTLAPRSERTMTVSAFLQDQHADG